MAEVGLSLVGRSVTFSITAAGVGDPTDPIESVDGLRPRQKEGGLESTNFRSGGHWCFC